MKSRYQNYFLLFGVTVLAVMLTQLDYAEVWRGISHAGYWFLAVIFIWVFLYMLNTAAWYLIIRSQEDRETGRQGVKPFFLYKVTISGFALNYATPGGLMGGEAYRIMALAPYLGTERATSSVILYVMTHIFSHFWFWLLALILFLLVSLTPCLPVSLNSPPYWGGVGGGASLLFILLGLWFFMVGYRKGLAVRVMNVLRHIPFVKGWAGGMVERHREQLDNIDRQIAALHKQQPRTFVTCVLLELLCRILSSLEIYFVLLVLQPSLPDFLNSLNSLTPCLLGFLVSFFILAFTSLFANLLFFIPLQLGGREGGFLMSATALGLSVSAGVFIALIIRLRELIWTAIGLLLIKFSK